MSATFYYSSGSNQSHQSSNQQDQTDHSPDISQDFFPDISPFPNGIGHFLRSPDKSPILQNLPPKTIIRIFGIAGSGKGTLAKLLTKNYSIANLETSYILRSATWVYYSLGLELNDQNTTLVFDQVQITFQDQALQFIWNGKVLTDKELRSNIVQQNVSKLSGNPFFRSEYYKRINHILKNLVKEPVILDGRGSDTPYLKQAKVDGYNIIRIFLWSNDEVNSIRYRSNYILKNSIQNPSKEQETIISSEFQTNIIDRNNSDYENAISNNLGLLTKDTGIIDSSYLTPEQVLDVAVDFVNKQIISPK